MLTFLIHLFSAYHVGVPRLNGSFACGGDDFIPTFTFNLITESRFNQLGLIDLGSFDSWV